MRFATPEYLYLLVLVPLLLLVYLYSNYRRRKRLKEYGDADLLKELMPDVSAYRPNVKFWLSTIALALLVVVLARPQFGSKMESVTRQGIEVVIALDISNSMLAEDIAPNRLEKSKKIISKLIDKFENDKIGLIVFAGDAFVQLPITNDFVSAKMFMETISPALITRQGTDIGAAINLAMKSFTPEKEVGKAVIVITDGENHEGGAEEAARAAVEKGMSVYILGVGSPDGAPIPTEGSNDYRRDKNGNVIVTKLNEEMSQNIAKAGNGAYIRVDNTNNAQKLLEKELDKLAKADVTTEVYTDYDEQFHFVALLVLLFLVMDILILPGKSRLTKNFNLFGEKK
ncbi:MAG: VWA domain-containing protein [Bacteroidaceae bacterium]|nr:VWA domain-containing protein [Bacteroidaceae bacterium]MBQ8735877.1 VWA domain-containing protein [Bacteroidaceae bacterium]